MGTTLALLMNMEGEGACEVANWYRGVLDEVASGGDDHPIHVELVSEVLDGVASGGAGRLSHVKVALLGRG